MKRQARPKAARRSSTKTTGEIANDAAALAQSTSPAVTYTEDDIRRRAYELYEARSGRGGDALSDWLTAEREIKTLSVI